MYLELTQYLSYTVWHVHAFCFSFLPRNFRRYRLGVGNRAFEEEKERGPKGSLEAF